MKKAAKRKKYFISTVIITNTWYIVFKEMSKGDGNNEKVKFGFETNKRKRPQKIFRLY